MKCRNTDRNLEKDNGIISWKGTVLLMDTIHLPLLLLLMCNDFKHNLLVDLLTFSKLVTTPPPWRRRKKFYVDDTAISLVAFRCTMIYILQISSKRNN